MSIGSSKDTPSVFSVNFRQSSVHPQSAPHTNIPCISSQLCHMCQCSQYNNNYNRKSRRLHKTLCLSKVSTSIGYPQRLRCVLYGYHDGYHDGVYMEIYQWIYLPVIEKKAGNCILITLQVYAHAFSGVIRALAIVTSINVAKLLSFAMIHTVTVDKRLIILIATP